MKLETENWSQVVDALGTIRQELKSLGARVAALEAAASVPQPNAAPAPAPSAPPAADAAPETVSEGPNEELVLVIAAAIAAFLGKKPHVRQIRLLESPAWAQQGRVTIQASHALSVRRS